MRIVTWNLLYGNKRKKDGIQHILSLNPDIICLQEVPYETLNWLEAQVGHVVNACFDWKNVRGAQRNAYVGTITKQKPLSVHSYKYDYGPARSILGGLLYKTLLQNIEQHMVITITLKIRNRLIQVANTRLSCAVGTIDRLEEFQTMVAKTRKPNIPTIYCGDFNVVDSKLFNQITGWIRGFTKQDYRVNERTAFETLYRKNNLINIFKGKSTTFFRRPILQLDHILVPKTIPITRHEIIKKQYSSDHKILVVDIDV